MSLKKAIAAIKRNKTFLITTHVGLEGDALGSEIAFYRLVRKLGKRAYMVNEDRTPQNYNFLPGVDKIRNLQVSLKKVNFDCFVILDCSSLSRCGGVGKFSAGDAPVLNIDHHISNRRFGNINWVKPQASSTAQMVYELYGKMGVKLDKEAAIALYVGILTDTGSFRYTNTGRDTHRIVSELMKYKFSASEIYRNIYGSMTFREMRLLTAILPKIKLDGHGKIASVQIERELLKRGNFSFDLSEYVLSFARCIKGIEVAVLFKESPARKHEIRVNLRSRGNADVNRIATFFGGGGHKTASGITLKGRLADVRKKVLAKIKEHLR